jgi:hypothetical protein
MSYVFMSAPFGGFGCVRSPLSVVGGAHLFRFHACSLSGNSRFVFNNTLGNL